MARCRLPAAVTICAALLAACGDGDPAVVAASSTTTWARDVGTTTTVAAPPTTVTTTARPLGPLPITFTLGINDNGLRLRLRPGDEVVPRLPVTALAETGWDVLIPPDPAVLTGGDDLLWRPSETDHGRLAFHEFYFMASGPGQTTVILTRGWQEFMFTVVVSPAE